MNCRKITVELVTGISWKYMILHVSISFMTSLILRSFMLKYLGSSSIQFWSLISTLNVAIYCILWILIMQSEILLYPSSKIINSSVGLYSFVSIYHSVCPIVETISFKLFWFFKLKEQALRSVLVKTQFKYLW